MKESTGERELLRVRGAGTVYRGPQGSGTQSTTFPQVCVTPSGRWYCTFRASPQKVSNAGQRVLLSWSDDQGVSWSPPREPFSAPDYNGAPGRFRTGGLTALGGFRLIAVLAWVDDSDPERPYFNEATEGLLDTRICLSNSEDGGETWSTPRFVDTPPFDVPTPLTGPILALPCGTLVCQFELNKPYDEAAPWRHMPVLFFSGDGGVDWTEYAVPAQDGDNRIFYWDQRPSVVEGECLLDVFWTYDRALSEYRTIHATESLDGGRTWAAIWDTGVPGQPGPACALADGSLAMPFVDRTAAPAIRVRRSTDGGRTFSASSEITLYASSGASQSGDKASMQEAWNEMYAFSVGLPHAVPLPGGGALIAYYAGDATDSTGIHWATVR